MYQVNFRSKKYAELKKLVNCGGRICIHCGRMLSHPQSILSHTGPKCLENIAKRAELKKQKKNNQ